MIKCFAFELARVSCSHVFHGISNELELVSLSKTKGRLSLCLVSLTDQTNTEQ